jgi:hypothetical protein
MKTFSQSCADSGNRSQRRYRIAFASQSLKRRQSAREDELPYGTSQPKTYARQLLKSFDTAGFDHFVDWSLQILQRLGGALIRSDAKLISPLLIEQACDLI